MYAKGLVKMELYFCVRGLMFDPRIRTGNGSDRDSMRAETQLLESVP